MAFELFRSLAGMLMRLTSEIFDLYPCLALLPSLCLHGRPFWGKFPGHSLFSTVLDSLLWTVSPLLAW